MKDPKQLRWYDRCTNVNISGGDKDDQSFHHRSAIHKSSLNLWSKFKTRKIKFTTTVHRGKNWGRRHGSPRECLYRLIVNVCTSSNFSNYIGIFFSVLGHFLKIKNEKLTVSDIVNLTIYWKLYQYNYAESTSNC